MDSNADHTICVVRNRITEWHHSNGRLLVVLFVDPGRALNYYIAVQTANKYHSASSSADRRSAQTDFIDGGPIATVVT